MRLSFSFKQFALTLFIAATLSFPALAQVPRTFSIQGFVSDGAGNAVADGAHQITVAIYDTPTGGSPLYSQSMGAEVRDGVFSTIVGESMVIPETVAFDRQYYIGIAVDGGQELAPRTKLTSTPNAIRATVADSLALPFAASYAGPGPAVFAIERTAAGHAIAADLNSGSPSAGAAILGRVKDRGTAVLGLNTGASGRAGSFSIVNEASVGAALYASTNGTGSGADIRVENGASITPALLALSNGAAGSSAGMFQMSGRGAGLVVSHIGESGRLARFMNGGDEVIAFHKTGAASFSGGVAAMSDNNTVPAISGLHTGNGRAGSFRITGGGFGTAVFGGTSGTGRAGDFQIQNTSSTAPALFAASDGTGQAALLQMSGNGTGITVVHRGTAGNIAVFQSGTVQNTVARIDLAGRGFFNGGVQSSGADLAEAFAVEGRPSEYEPGDVLVISTSSDRTVEKSSSAQSSRVAGVYATKPGVLLTERLEGESMIDLVPMGVIGVIPTKVTGENGPIRRGDLLVTSSTPGHAMRAGDDPRLGTVIGKALEEFSGSASGMIKVLVSVR